MLFTKHFWLCLVNTWSVALLCPLWSETMPSDSHWLMRGRNSGRCHFWSDGLRITFPSHCCTDCVRWPVTSISPELSDSLRHRSSRWKTRTIPETLLCWLGSWEAGFSVLRLGNIQTNDNRWATLWFWKKVEISTSLDSLVTTMNRTSYPTHSKHVA